MVPTFQSPRHRRQSIHYLCLKLTVSKCCPPIHSFLCGKRWKSERTKSRLYGGCQTFSIENAAGATLFQLQCAPEHCHEERQCLKITFLFACSELLFADIEFTLYEAAVMVMPQSVNSTKRTPFPSQNTIAKQLLMEKVCLNFFGLFGEWECIHCWNCSFVSWFLQWTNVSSPVTILLTKSSSSSWYRWRNVKAAPIRCVLRSSDSILGTHNTQSLWYCSFPDCMHHECVHPTSKFLHHCCTLLSFMTVSSHTLIIHQWISAALHPSAITAHTSHLARLLI